MVLLSDLMDKERLQEDIDNRFIRKVSHPTLPLDLYNYTAMAMVKDYWVDTTRQCRGLVVEQGTDKVVARCMTKSFNYGQKKLTIDDSMPVEVTDKIDGSYLQGFVYNGNLLLTTRGSFSSEQALHAQKIWNDNYSDIVLPEGYTLVWEIVYAANRVVVDYGDMDDLVLLMAIHNEYGYYLGPNEASGLIGWTGPTTPVFPAKTMAEVFALPPRPNAEGVMVRSGNTIIKVKELEYLRLHKILTNTNSRSIWEALSAGVSLDNFLEGVPDEFVDWVRETADKLNKQHSDIVEKILQDYQQFVPYMHDRKDFAQRVSKHPYRSAMFSLLDGKSIDGLVWKMIKPEAEKPFSARSEDVA